MIATAAHALREALLLAVLLAAPPTLAALIAGALAGLLQSATQVKDHAISTVPRLLAALAALAATSPFIAAQATRFGRAMLEALPAIGKL